LLADTETEGLHGAGGGRGNRVLHFHGFENQQRGALFHPAADRGDQRDDLAGHRRRQAALGAAAAAGMEQRVDAGKDEGEAVGIITLSECFAVYTGGNYGIINEMYVLPEYRNKNIGAILIDKTKEIAAERNWGRIDVTTPVENKKRVNMTEQTNNNHSGIKSFPRNFWTVIVMEFFERGSYYGVMSVLSVYLVLSIDEGGLGFSKESVGIIKSTITPLLYLLPILSGALADRFGYRKTLFFAFTVMSIGYFLTSISTSYGLVFASLLLMVTGAGFFKPIISGTIARSTDKNNSTLAFGIFYWTINLGAFIFPLVLVPMLKSISWSYIFIMAAVGTGWLLILNTFVYKEPQKPESIKKIGEVLLGAVKVLGDYRFVLMIVIYSGFWILYFQMFDTVLWYLTEYVDTTPVNEAVNSFLGLFMSNPSWKFDAEHVTVINAGTIILLQIFISNIVKNTKALPTMIFGIALGTIGMGILALSMHIWVFMAGIIIFSIGEMTAHPKFISYVGLIAPEDKKALYLGYSFLYGVLGSGIGGVLGANLYVHFVDNLHQPGTLWFIFSMIGVVTIIGLVLYNKFLAPKTSGF